MNFREITENEAIIKAVEKLGFTEATEIQEKAIPVVREGHDILAQSQTGTGKTAAFSIPAIEKLDMELEATQTLVICPTRELAVQVANEFRKFTDRKSVV